MNEKFIIITAIVIAVASSVLVRPEFWKQRKKLIGSDIFSCISGQLVVGIICFFLTFFGIENNELIFFNGKIIISIVSFIVNILIGNYLLTGGSYLNTFKSKNFLISCCILVVFSILTFVLHQQFSQVIVTTTETEAKSLEDVLLDDTIAMERTDVVKAAKLRYTDSSYSSYASNGRIIYWFSSNAAVILHDNKAWVKEYKEYNDTPLLLKSYKEIGLLLDEENNLYKVFAIIKYKDFSFYVDHYTLYDYENELWIDCKKLPTLATNK